MSRSSFRNIMIANVISGISLITLITFGASYLFFKNSPIYTDYKIEITNNPITKTKNIEFFMTGTKVLDCTANNVYAIAVNSSNGFTTKLDEFVSMYTHNTTPGVEVKNAWTLKNPGLTPGSYRVTMISDWSCRHWIFKDETTRYHDGILLIAE